MSRATYHNFTGSAAEHYQSFFVPAIAAPVSGELLRTADLQPGERVLDVACGTGVVTRAAAERVGPTGSVTGLDLAPDMIEVAQATPAVGAPIDWHQGDAATLPFSDGFFDVSLCQMGIMFMEDQAGALAEMHRVLAPGGRAVLNTPGAIQPMFEAMERAIVEHIDPGLGSFVSAIFSMHDPSVLEARLRDAGFNSVSSREYVAHFDLPGPVDFLWNYIDITPMGPLVAQAPESARAALESGLVDAWSQLVVDGRMVVDQPMAIAWGRR